MRRFLFALACLLIVSGTTEAQIGAAPTGKCAFNLTFDRPGTALLLPSGQRNIYVGGNVIARCPSQGIVLKSDSLEYYGDEGRSFFIGHVDYSEPARLKLKSDFLTYFQREERLLAFLNVDATLATGSNLKGNQLEYWRSIPKVRQQRANSVGRPTISIIEKDSAGNAQPPVTVTGNNVYLEGDSIVAASGEVVVVRPELTANGDSLFLDGGTGLLRLMRNPRVIGTKGRPFTLIGQTIDVLSRQRRLERVLSVVNAQATSQDLDLKSDTIDMRIANDVLQRAVAWGQSRARAVSPQRTIIADSIDVLMPDQRLRELHAVRLAVAEGAPDSLKFRTPEKDRLSGDTIVAYFDTAAPPVRDTTAKPRIKRLLALGNATSYQHVPPRDTLMRTPGVVYVTGKTITVTFDSAGVERVTVKNDELASGIYLEPITDSTSTARRAAMRDTTAGAARLITPGSAVPLPGSVAAPAPGSRLPGTSTPAVPTPAAPVPAAPVPSGSAVPAPTAVPPRRP